MAKLIRTFYFGEEEAEQFDKVIEELKNEILDYEKSKGFSLPQCDQKVFVYNLVCDKEIMDIMIERMNANVFWQAKEES